MGNRSFGPAAWLEKVNRAVLGAHVRRATADAAPGRRIGRAEWSALIAYLVLLCLSRSLVPICQAPAGRVLLALLPLPAALAIVLLAVRRVLGLDELEQRIELAALAVASVGTWLGLLTCWLLQHAGLAVPPLSLWLVALPALRGIAAHWVRRHYA
jgi:hypothetical protein